MILLLIGCSSNLPGTETVPAAGDVVTTIRASATATHSPTATPVPPKLTNTPLPTPTSTPSPTLVPISTPTISPWLFEDLSSFFFYNDGHDLYRVNTNGERQLLTTADLPFMGQPWSPDGANFLYIVPSFPNIDSACVANLITGETHPLDIQINYTAYWSPDGKSLLYPFINEDLSLDLSVYNFENFTSRQLIKIPEGFDTFIPIAGWSPDSQQVAFSADLDGQQDLYKIDIDTLELQRLTNTPELEVQAVWSPVDNLLVVGTNSTPGALSYGTPFTAGELHLIDGNGQQLLSLGQFEELVDSVSWSPDGEQIAYSENGKLCIIHLTDGITICPLEETFLRSTEWATAVHSSVAWSANGNWIAFQSVEIGELQCFRIFIFDLKNNILVEPEFPTCTFSDIYWSRAAP
jgi:WD40 repeat protein